MITSVSTIHASGTNSSSIIIVGSSQMTFACMHSSCSFNLTSFDLTSLTYVMAYS